MHDDPTADRPRAAARRFPGRAAAGAGAVVVVALAAAWGMTAGSGPAARTVATADHGPDGGEASARGRAEATESGDPQEGTESGDLPEGRELTPFDTRYPAVGRLDERLLKAVQEAARDARDDGIEFRVTSGWRSREHQQRLLDEGIEKYGSEEKARQFVNTPQKSTHVSGKAVDIGPTDADDWLIRNGSDYGLCQVYNNEMWHFELLTGRGGTCPAPLRDAAG
ncbi:MULTISPECIES: M15 family metallopeptidase [unclassified Streptomyces]|jgi:D-alanyl-D-alanine carboxypeptidase|uniref:M15 family metallopeptidase n=1 Tax=unclassified Streptomyces TaxID=2593676 RepID=UPI00081B201D|nr:MULTISPECIES: M15 family metallopeptidase [unclassified Streptomyces]MYQ84867.1 peptidase M15 [Streptomyces sp. SID4936]SCD94377.1 D-alanyl-D-alanine carboxypeptidase [Streptomyces sp. DvalAA-43]